MYVTSRLWRLVKAHLDGIVVMTWWTLLPVILNAVHLMSWYLLLLTLMSGDGTERIAIYAVLVVFLCLVQRGTEHILTIQKARYGGKFKNSFRTELFEKLFYLGPGFIDRKQSGELIITLWQKIDWINFYLFIYIPTSWMIVIFSILCAIAWFITQPIIGLIILLSGLVVVAAPPVFHKLLKTSGEEEWEGNDEFYSTCLDGLQGITTLKAFNANALHRQKVEEQSEKNRKATMSNLVLTTLNSRIMELLISAGEVAADVVGVWAIMSGFIETHHLVMLFMLMRAWAYGARHIFGAWLRGNKGIAAFESAWEILNAECAYSLTSISGGKREAQLSTGENGDIEFDRVSFSYADIDHPTIRDVSFSAKSGTQIALVGSSGSGKSTVARLLFGFYKPQHGTIKVGGKTLGAENVSAIQQMITVIWQDCHIFHMSCFDNIKIAKPDASVADVYEAARKANIHEMISQLPEGYDTVIGDGGRTFSGGEKQRIALARAFLRNAPILILDEATSSLDRRNELEIQNCIRELSKGKTVLTIAHRLDTIRDADQICVMESGVIVERGTHEELLKNGERYCELMGMERKEGDTCYVS